MENNTVDDLHRILYAVRVLNLEFDLKDALIVGLFKMSPLTAHDALLSTMRGWNAASTLPIDDDPQRDGSSF